MQLAACSLQLAACSLQLAACSLQPIILFYKSINLKNKLNK
ncbi:Beta-galactosidase [Pseudomonas chlororaphis]|nr:Beta-galactosidase [Pseudomonas chlororaphis]